MVSQLSLVEITIPLEPGDLSYCLNLFFPSVHPVTSPSLGFRVLYGTAYMTGCPSLPGAERFPGCRLSVLTPAKSQAILTI